MFKSNTCKFKYGNYQVIIETGIIARQANASAIVNMENTTVLVTAVINPRYKKEQNFSPLTINYQERTYAVGKVPGSFFRREGRPNENEIIISRLIDRTIRPLFPKYFSNEIQIIATVISINKQINPDIVAMIGTSTVLSMSGIPFYYPFGVARIGYINNKYILNPSKYELKKSKLNLVVSGTVNTILMVELESKLLNEKQILGAIIFGHEQQQIVINNINKFINNDKKNKLEFKFIKINIILHEKIILLSINYLIELYCIYEKKNRYLKIKEIEDNIINKLLNKKDNKLFEEEILNSINQIKKNIIKKKILYNNNRIDSRKKDEIREINAFIGILPRTHGSSLFTRGDTQALVITTLGTEKDAQNIEELYGGRTDRFILHYNFLPYCVGEIGLVGYPKRREIGHGNLAKKAILPVMPNNVDFPYTIRIVSEITESNGSSSMASVCGASLALMDAGVPIKTSIAGVAMGLIIDNNKFVILSDIISDEDHFGDMDLKIAGSFKGITALQMDIKIKKISFIIIKIALDKSKKSRIFILKKMNLIINKPRGNISKFAPRIYIMKIIPDKIKYVIGKRGSVIKYLTKKTSTIIEIDNNGIVKVSSIRKKNIIDAVRFIEDIIAEVKVGCVYRGEIIRVVNFGVFISIENKNKEGLVHISQITNRYIKKISDYLKLGQKVLVKVLEMDSFGCFRLSIKQTTNIN